MQSKSLSKVSSVNVTKPSPSTTLEERVAQLEALLRSQAAESTPQPSQGTEHDFDDFHIRGRDPDRSTNPHTPLLDHQSEIDECENIHGDLDPPGTLFNNAIWKKHERQKSSRIDTPPNTSNLVHSGTIYSKMQESRASRVCDELCEGLPSPRLIAQIVEATSDLWWNSRGATGYWLQTSMTKRNISTLQEVVNWTLASAEPPVAAIGVICIATCLQQLGHHHPHHQHIIRQLRCPPGALFQEYLSRVYRLIINHNGYSNSNAGIEVIMMAGKAYMNLGLLKMNWILVHRAVSHAQLLGTHLPHRITFDKSTSDENLRREIWFSICERDLYSSLLLGLPYAVHWKTIPPGFQGAPGTLRAFQYQLMKLSSRIIDRNQFGLEHSVSETRDIEDAFDLVFSELPPKFQNAPLGLQLGMITQREFLEHVINLFWFWQARVILHQPLMIQSLEDHELLEHRDACLNACRETLKIYRLVSSEKNSAFSLCRVAEHQVFICATILILGILGYGSLNPPPLVLDQNQDWKTVQDTIEILQKVSTDSNSTIASQALESLKTLAGLVPSVDGSGTTCQHAHSSYVKLTVPGSGVITISPGHLIQRGVPPIPESTSQRPLPIFNLSHGDDQALLGRNMGVQNQAADVNHFGNVELDTDVPIMDLDLDWLNVIGTDLDNDWAWLADVNNNGVM